jgi:SMC interacting uncharacterized protein involved in chromosome segregation
MEAPNIQLYNLFRNDLHLNDGKSLELMNLLDKEYKSGVKEDLNILDKKVDARFDDFGKKVDARFDDFGKKVDARFEKIDARFEKVDARFDAFGKNVDARFEKVDARFQKIEDRLSTHDKRFDALDFKIDLRSAELGKAISDSRVEITHWMIGIILLIIGLIIANLLKK